MTKTNWHCIGLMSGTSLDGVDLIYVKFSLDKGYKFDILQTESIPYSEKWKNRLQSAFTENGENLTSLDVEYGRYLAKCTLGFKERFSLEKIDFVASHGHTIFHQPERGFTLQIGEGSALAAETGLKVICNFRVQDVALGGQGAPLVPIGDELLFSDYDFCLNLGGFANVSYRQDEVRKAYDICPANIVLNHYTRQAGFEFDDRGRMASAGKLHEELLEELNELPFYGMTHPKSLGYEFVVDTVLPIIEKFNLDLKDILHTYSEHAAMQISEVLNRAVLKNQLESASVLVTGGGAFNDFLIDRIEFHSRAEIVLPDREIIEFKEALIFAFLGLLKEQNEVNCLKSVTGARKDHSSGVVYQT